MASRVRNRYSTVDQGIRGKYDRNIHAKSNAVLEKMKANLHLDIQEVIAEEIARGSRWTMEHRKWVSVYREENPNTRPHRG